MFRRSFTTSVGVMSSIKTVTVFGSGQMGGGIALSAAQNGFAVNLVDVNPEILKKNMNTLEKNLERGLKKLLPLDASAEDKKKYVTDVMSRIQPLSDNKTAVASSDLVIEAIVEKLEVKQALFAELDKLAPAHTIFASNTSSLSVQDIAMTSTRKDRFGGLHFFNPVAVMKLVEVIRAPETSDATDNALYEFGKAVGKTPVKCTDKPGFIVNRLLVPYIFEAIELFERGDASMEDIDNAMKLGASYPMGPFQLADYVGLDTLKFIMDGWIAKYPELGFKPSPTVNNLVQQGKLGLKSKQGFYTY